MKACELTSCVQGVSPTDDEFMGRYPAHDDSERVSAFRMASAASCTDTGFSESCLTLRVRPRKRGRTSGVGGQAERPNAPDPRQADLRLHPTKSLPNRFSPPL
jgi:hypothetical protein